MRENVGIVAAGSKRTIVVLLLSRVLPRVCFHGTTHRNSMPAMRLRRRNVSVTVQTTVMLQYVLYLYTVFLLRVTHVIRGAQALHY